MFPSYRNQLTGFYMMGTLLVKGLKTFVIFELERTLSGQQIQKTIHHQG